MQSLSVTSAKSHNSSRLRACRQQNLPHRPGYLENTSNTPYASKEICACLVPSIDPCRLYPHHSFEH